MLQLVVELCRNQDSDDPFAFRQGPQEYVLRTGGGGAQTATFDWNEELRASLDAVRRPGCDPALAVALGDKLYQFLAPTEWLRYEAELIAAVERGESTCITFRFTAAELYSLPWELLTVRGTGQHLAGLPRVLLRYAWPETHTAPTSPSRPEGGRILFAWSSAAGSVPAADHQEALAAAAREGFFSFDAEHDVLPHVSARQLDKRLREYDLAGDPVAVLHVLCHGTRTGSVYSLGWDDEDATGLDAIDGARLRQLLSPFVQRLRLVVLCACDGADNGVLGNHLGSIAQALHRVGIQAVVGSRYPLSVVGSIQLATSLYEGLLGESSSLESAVLAARKELTKLSTFDWAGLQLYARPEDGDDTRPVVFRPYRGLLRFQGEHQRFFFGRESEVAEAIADMEKLVDGGKPRFLVILGASGTGKSSLALAAAAPSLVQRRGWQTVSIRPSGDGPAALELILQSQTEHSLPLLIVVDQLEEIFYSLTSAARTQFVRRLWGLASLPESGVAILATFRVDQLGRCSEVALDDQGLHLDQVFYDEAHRVFLTYPGKEQLRQIIERPAAGVGLTLEAGLTDRILADVSNESGVLPLLEYALDMLWQQRQGACLTQAVYTNLNGVGGALEGEAEKTWAGLTPRQKETARRLLLGLVETSSSAGLAIRRRVPLNDLRPEGPVEQLIFDSVQERLLGGGLLTLSEGAPATMVELAHESILRRWKRLVSWVQDDLQRLLDLARLRSLTQEWRQFQDALLRDDQLRAALRFQAAYPNDVDADMRALIKRSAAAVRRNWLMRGVVLALAFGYVTQLCITIVLSYWTAQQAQTAALVGAATAMKRSEPIVAALLLMEARTLEKQEPFGGINTAAEVAQHPLPMGVLRMSGRGVSRAVFHPDGRRVVLVGRSGEVQLRQADGTGKPVRLGNQEGRGGQQGQEGQDRKITEVSFNKDGSCVAVTAKDGLVQVFRTDVSDYPLALRGSHQEVTSTAFSPDGARLLLTYEDGTTYNWSLQHPGEPTKLLGHGDPLSASGFSAEGVYTVTAAEDGALRLWPADGSGPLSIGHHARVANLKLSPDGSRVASTSKDGTVRIWLRRAGAEPVELRGHQGQVRSLAFSADGARVATTSPDGTVRVWPTDGQDKPVVLRGFEGGATGAAFNLAGTQVLTTAESGDAQLWPLDGRSEPVVFGGHQKAVIGAWFSLDSSRVLTASADGTARLWRVDGSGKPMLLSGHQKPLTGAAFSPNGNQIVTSSQDGTARLWRIDDGAESAVLRGHTDEVTSATFGKNGTRILTTSKDHSARLWHTDGSVAPAVLQGHNDEVTSGAFSSDGSRVLTASKDQTVRLWQVDSHKPSFVLLGHNSAVTAAKFGPDALQILTVAAPSVRIWRSDRLDQFMELAEQRGLGGWVNSAVLSPDGRFVATAAQDRLARIYSTHGTSEPRRFAGHTGWVNSVAFSPDGTRIATASNDGTARVWRADGTGEPLILRGHTGWVSSVAFSPDGTRLATSGADGTTRVYRVTWDSLVSYIASATTVCLSAAQRQRFLGQSARDAETSAAACESSHGRPPPAAADVPFTPLR